MKIVLKGLKQTNPNTTPPQPTPIVHQPVMTPPPTLHTEPTFTIAPEHISLFHNAFATVSKGASTVGGKDAFEYFQNSGLSMDYIKSVWLLVDYKKERVLKRQAFCVAMYLITQKRKNPDFTLPSLIPFALLDEIDVERPMERKLSNSSPMQTGNSPILSSVNQPMTTPRGSLILENRVNSLMKDASTLKGDLFSTQSLVQDQGQRIETLKEQEKTILNDMKSYQSQLDDLKGTRQRLLIEQSQIEARLLHLREEKQGNAEYLEQIRAESERLTQIKERGQQSVVELTDEVEHQSSVVQSEAEDLETKKAEIIKLKNQYQMLMVRKRDAEEDFSSSQLNEMKDEMRKLQQETDDLSLKVVTLESRNKESARGIQDNQKILADYKSKRDELKEKLSVAQKTLDENASTPNLKSKQLKLKELVDSANNAIAEISSIIGGKEDGNSFANSFPTPEIAKPEPKKEIKTEVPKKVEVKKEEVKKMDPKPEPKKEEPKKSPLPPPVQNDGFDFDEFTPNKKTPQKGSGDDFDFDKEFSSFDEKKPEGGNDPWGGFEDMEFEKKPEKKVNPPPVPVPDPNGFDDNFDPEF